MSFVTDGRFAVNTFGGVEQSSDTVMEHDFKPLDDAAIRRGRNAMMTLVAAILFSAVFYAAAMILLKLWTDSAMLPAFVHAMLVFTAFGFGAWFEIVALRVERLGIIYVAILGAECIVIAVASVVWFGEEFSPKEIVGTMLIVVGTAIAWS